MLKTKYLIQPVIEDTVSLLLSTSSLLCLRIIPECSTYFQIGRQGTDVESDIDQTGNQSSESSSYYTAASSSSSEASSRRSSGVLVDSLENVNTGIRNMKYTSDQCTSVMKHYSGD